MYPSQLGKALRHAGSQSPAVPEFGNAGWAPGAACTLVLLLIFLVGLTKPAIGADIRSTPHNLAEKSSPVAADEICVFCHTPQIPANLEGGTGPASSPVWQPSLRLDHSFLMFDDIGRKQQGVTAIGSQSIACLSCHDATQAFSVTMSTGDHPFGIPYRGFSRGVMRQVAAERRSDDSPSRSALHLKGVDDFRLPSEGKMEDRTIWWVSSNGISAVRTRTDLPLYTRQSESGEVPYVECSSCHDPHLARRLFLRVSNEGSKLCLTCHDK